MMNWKGYGRKLLWHDLRYPGFYLEGLKKSTKKAG
jgi:hypothetical protein